MLPQFVGSRGAGGLGAGIIFLMPDFEGFLSYTHLDHELGEITEFKKALENMVARLRGTPFVLFQDQDGIRTGDLWEQRIEHALTTSSVLIAILTPTFFNRKWCRYEVERFLQLKEEQGKPVVLIPIYWMKTPVMETPDLLKDHPIAQKVSARQYHNWTEHFGEPMTSPPLRRALKQVGEALLQQLATAPAPVPVVVPAPVTPPKATPRVTPRTKAHVVRLEVTNAPVGALLTVNGIAAVGLVYEFTLPTDEHEHPAEVIVSAPGFRSEEWDVVISGGSPCRTGGNTRTAPSTTHHQTPFVREDDQRSSQREQLVASSSSPTSHRPVSCPADAC